MQGTTNLTLTPGFRKLLQTLHITFAVGWPGEATLLRNWLRWESIALLQRYWSRCMGFLAFAIHPLAAEYVRIVAGRE